MNYRPKKFRRFAALFFCVALLATACGGGEETSANDGAEGEEATPTTDEGTEPEAEDDQAEEPYFAGKTIEIVVGFDPGGGADTVARFYAPMFEKHIEGNPTVRVVNEPGGGGIVAASKFAQRPADGQSILITTGGVHLAHIFGDSNLALDYGDIEPVVLQPTGVVVYAGGNTGVSEPADLLSPEEDLVLGVVNVGGSETARILALDLLGVDFQIVPGYEGGAARRVAFEQGETNLHSEVTSTHYEQMVPLIEEGKASAVFSLGQLGPDGLGPDPAVPDLPYVHEAYEQMHGEQFPDGPEREALNMAIGIATTYGKLLSVHAAAPEEAREALHAAAVAMQEDPEYIEGTQNILEGYSGVAGDALVETTQRLLSPDPAVVDWLATYLLEEHGLDVYSD